MTKLEKLVAQQAHHRAFDVKHPIKCACWDRHSNHIAVAVALDQEGEPVCSDCKGQTSYNAAGEGSCKRCDGVTAPRSLPIPELMRHLPGELDVYALVLSEFKDADTGQRIERYVPIGRATVQTGLPLTINVKLDALPISGVLVLKGNFR